MKRTAPVLLTLLFGLQLAQAQPARTPRQLIDGLGVEIRQILETPRSASTPEDAERRVAEQITALASRSPGDDALVAPDAQGRTPLMLAVSGAYPLVVKALLADPVVKARINAPDKADETAWMVASFAPAMTLVACQPGALTLERYPLLRPYLQRMSLLMTTGKSAVAGIVQALEDAGAEANPGAARKAWLARCPNTAPDLRQALARGEVLTTLVNDALERQMGFNKAYRSGLTNIPQKPPQDMRFNASLRPPMAVKDVNCPRMRRPELPGGLDWHGSVGFKTVIATRAGVVESVDFTVLPGSDPPPVVINHFIGTLIRTLAGYHCEGEHVFEQEFRFTVN